MTIWSYCWAISSQSPEAEGALEDVRLAAQGKTGRLTVTGDRGGDS
ncbi:hypothetical protein NE236_04740 [Actinoallomurus purpureus]|nr:hypothetical protein [Actinoallomurus purpureus]MCO6004280.1 hypothetical protein [Actinoallomurus purpureus]